MVQPASPPSRVVLAVAQQTDPGLDPDKQVNEDACAAADLGLGHLLVVCDGMGGHMGGKDASEAAIRTILGDIEAAPVGTHPGAALKAAIEHAGRVVFDLGGSGANLLRPGSTVVAILSHAGGSEIAHVGDSRAYLMRGGQIHPLTRDHSMVQQMVDAGVLRPEEAMGHPDANKITRALGMTAAVEVELRPTPLAHQQGDVFLLASDGLCDLVVPSEMLGMVTQAKQAGGGLEQACQQLVVMANARGGHDNITVVLAEVLECPVCSESKTFVPIDGVAVGATPPATVPVLPALGGDSSVPGGLHPTVVDDGGPGQPAGVSGMPTAAPVGAASGAPVPTWVGDDGPERDSDVEVDLARRRRVMWLVIGAAFVLFGALMIIGSIWWAFAAAAQADTGPGPRFAAAGQVPSGLDEMAYTHAARAASPRWRRHDAKPRFVS